MTRYAIGVGSNEGDRVGHLRAAVRRLGEVGVVDAVSGLYETEPVGGPRQGPYLNAVVVLRCKMDPDSLLERLHQIESERGRARSVRWGSRTVDLDIITSDAPSPSGRRAQIPHPRAAEREFVLRPLVDVWAEAEVAEGVSASAALARMDPQGVDLVSETGWAKGQGRDSC